ncbi:MAG: amidohydrolase family protein [Gammaproteobacteria bacterium]
MREQVQRGADVINVYNTGSLLSPRSPAQTFSDDELRAIVDAAHSLNRKVVADGAGKRNSAAGVNAAIRAGADWIDTVIYPDKDTWPLLAKTGRFYAPHLYAVVAAVGDDEAHLSAGSMGWLPEPVLRELLALKREQPAAVNAHRAGIRMVFASDSGVFQHGRNAGEFAEYVKAGLTPAQAIAAATVNAAEALGLAADSGTLEVGKRADLIAVAGDPLADVRELLKVRAVVRAGEIVKRPEAPGVTP